MEIKFMCVRETQLNGLRVYKNKTIKRKITCNNIMAFHLQVIYLVIFKLWPQQFKLWIFRSIWKYIKRKKNQSLQQHRFSPVSLFSIIRGVRRYWFYFKNESSTDSFLGLKSLFILIFFKADFTINVHYTKMMFQELNEIGLFLTCHIKKILP